MGRTLLMGIVSVLWFIAPLTHGQELVFAQTSTRCNTPTVIDIDKQDFSLLPRPAADQYGRVHLVFSGGLAEQYPTPDAIFYSILDHGEWTNPVDVLAASEEAYAFKTLLSSKDQLLVDWRFTDNGVRGLRVSTAPLEKARLPQAWSSTTVFNGGILSSDMVQDAEGRIHLTYVHNDGATGAGGVVYTWSDDDGSTWSSPIDVVSVDARKIALNNISILATNTGRVHIVWAQNTQESGWSSQGIWYAFSDDLGTTWSEPEEVFPEPASDYPSLLQGAKPQNLYMTWVRGVAHDDSKYDRVSTDYGANWTEPEVLFHSLRGVNGHMRMAVDSAGTEYLVMSGDDPSGGGTRIWLSQHPDGGNWTQPIAISGAVGGSEHPQAVVVAGNELHIFWLSWEEKSVYHVQCSLPAPEIAAKALPTISQSQPDVAPTPVASTPLSRTSSLVETGQTNDPVVLSAAQKGLPTRQDNLGILGISVLPAGVVVILAVIWLVTRRRS